MDGGDRWRVGFHGGEASQDNSIISRIMLRFRPIMPKPACPNSSAHASQQASNNLKVKTKRSKRKYVRVCKNNNNTESEEKISSKEHEPVLTLQLMPEKDAQDHMKNYHYDGVGGDADEDQRVSSKIKGRIIVVETWVTVECITETCMDRRGLGFTDEERMRNLETDKCPGFVSDYFHKVKFLNNAFKKFVSVSDEEYEDADVITCLIVKESLPIMCSAFSCRVKLQYGDKKCSKMVPCDVWRMDFGGFAWKLDVKAALSLGL